MGLLLLAVIATSGVDYDIKLWEPVDDQACSLDDVSKASKYTVVISQYHSSCRPLCVCVCLINQLENQMCENLLRVLADCVLIFQ